MIRCFSTLASRVRTRLQSERGTVTAEFAVIVPMVVAVALLICSLGRAVIVRVNCQDAAHTIARQAIVELGGAGTGSEISIPAEFSQWADSSAEKLTGSGARVTLDPNGNELSVTVSAPLVADPWGILPRLVTGRAIALLT